MFSVCIKVLTVSVLAWLEEQQLSSLPLINCQLMHGFLQLPSIVVCFLTTEMLANDLYISAALFLAPSGTHRVSQSLDVSGP